VARPPGSSAGGRGDRSRGPNSPGLLAETERDPGRFANAPGSAALSAAHPGRFARSLAQRGRGRPGLPPSLLIRDHRAARSPQPVGADDLQDAADLALERRDVLGGDRAGSVGVAGADGEEELAVLVDSVEQMR
jgi:hypothetical protein